MAMGTGTGGAGTIDDHPRTKFSHTEVAQSPDERLKVDYTYTLYTMPHIHDGGIG